MIRRGTYHQGFAPRDRQPRYPQLWRGCIGSWNPGLGPTGNMLFDWSPYKNHGTLTNMDPATDWVVSADGRGGGYALDFEGTDYVNASRLQAIEGVGAMTISLFFQRRSAGEVLFLGKTVAGGSDTSRIAIEIYSDGNIYLEPTSGAANYASFAMNDAIMHHLAVVFDGSQTGNAARLKAYIDGVEKTLSFSGTIQSTTSASATGNFEIGRLVPGSAIPVYGNGLFGDVLIYDRAFSENEVRLSSARRGIAYEMRERRRTAPAAAARRFTAANLTGNMNPLMLGGMVS